MRTMMTLLALVVLVGCSGANPLLLSNPCQDTFGAAPNPCQDTFGAAPNPCQDTFGAAPNPCQDTFGAAPNPCQDTFGAAPNPCEPVYVKPDCNGGPKMGAAPDEPCIPTPVYVMPGCDPLGVGSTISGWHKGLFGCEPKGR